MKKTNITYWILTGLFAAFMFMSATRSLMKPDEAKAFMSTALGYPFYIIAFLSVAKILGVIAILVPGFPKLREWAYAGFFFDLTGALYSLISIHSPASQTYPFFIIIYIVFFGSYILYHKRLKAATI
jgi:hypothetical protein